MNFFPWYATELFLVICESGGLSAASRFGKIGISQPALSAQMTALEQYLGVSLFQRRPFLLTEKGKQFQEEAMRLRSRMNLLRHGLSTESAKPLRIAASDIIIRDYLPDLLMKLDAVTRTRLVLREAPSQDLACAVRDDEADLAIGMLSKHVGAGSTPLVEIMASLPLLLLVPPSHQEKVREWNDVVKLLKNAEKPRLVGLPQNNLIMQHTQAALRKSGLEWHNTLEVSSMSHIAKYVALDFGFGFAIQAPPSSSKNDTNHSIPIPETKMPMLKLGVWHTEHLDPLAVQMLKLIRSFAKKHIPS
jgi:DNA-binding transcriptional LysR family regulator